MKRIVIVGATSGIGRELAKGFAHMGWKVGIAGRHEDLLKQMQAEAPDRIEYGVIDVNDEEAGNQLDTLIERIGGMDLFFLSSGIGYQNLELNVEWEISTVQTNALGFTRMVTAAFQYFKKTGGGHIAVISSIAGTKGLGAAPAYSATKRFQRHYVNALSQLSHMQHLNICFTDIRPGFVKTGLLKGADYPMQMNVTDVAARIIYTVLHRRRSVVIDWRYSILVFLWSLIPEFIWERLPVKPTK